MRNGDSRQNGGLVLPLQHTGFAQDGYGVNTRNALLAYRVLGRLDKAGDVGHWLYEDKSVGDLIGGFLWREASEEKRPHGAWAFIVPTVVDVGGGRGGTPTPGGGGRPPVATGGGGGGSAGAVAGGAAIGAAAAGGAGAFAGANSGVQAAAGAGAGGGGGPRSGKISDLGDNTGVPIATEEYVGDNRFVPLPIKGPKGNVAQDPLRPQDPPPGAGGQQGGGVLNLGIGAQVYPVTGGQLGFGPGFNFAPGSGIGVGQSWQFNFTGVIPGGGSVGVFGGPRIGVSQNPSSSWPAEREGTNARTINPLDEK